MLLHSRATYTNMMSGICRPSPLCYAYFLRNNIVQTLLHHIPKLLYMICILFIFVAIFFVFDNMYSNHEPPQEQNVLVFRELTFYAFLIALNRHKIVSRKHFTIFSLCIKRKKCLSDGLCCRVLWPNDGIPLFSSKPSRMGYGWRQWCLGSLSRNWVHVIGDRQCGLLY